MHTPVITWASFVRTFQIKNVFGGDWHPYQAPWPFVPEKQKGGGLLFSFDYTLSQLGCEMSTRLAFFDKVGPFYLSQSETLTFGILWRR